MFASYQSVDSDNFNPVEIMNGYTEEEISFWDHNQFDNSTNSENFKSTYVTDEIRMQQKCVLEQDQSKVASNNIYPISTDEQNLENLIASAANLHGLCNDHQYAQGSYFSAQWPYASNASKANLSATQQKHHQNQKRNYKVNHHGRITIGQTPSGSFKAIVKRKRKRTMFTTQQVEFLEKIFSQKPYISRNDRQNIVKQLNLPDKSVKIWFQNRRLKEKRQDNEISDDISEDNDVVYVDSLDHVESEIQKNTDEFGYVTLDDRIMNDLVSAIDNCLTRNSDIEYSPPSDVTKNDDTSIYEPISPASSDFSMDHTSTSDWEPFEPSESLQRLLDIQSLIQV